MFLRKFRDPEIFKNRSQDRILGHFIYQTGSKKIQLTNSEKRNYLCRKSYEEERAQNYA